MRDRRLASRGDARLMPGPPAGYTLYTSGEPCLMCIGAILLAPVSTLVWAAGPIVVAGSAYDAVVRSGFNADRVAKLEVVREPDPISGRAAGSSCMTSSSRVILTARPSLSTEHRLDDAPPIRRLGVITPSSNTVLEPTSCGSRQRSATKSASTSHGSP